jgi:AAA family ATP:ADP antiporter
VSFTPSLHRFVDIRRGEGLALARAAGALFAILAAHTMLETVRDALLLTRLRPRDLGGIYVAAAIAAVPVALITARASARWGPRRTLVAALVLVALSLVGFFLLPSSEASVLGLYVVSGVIGTAAIPLYWSLLGNVFTVSDARRLLGTVTAVGTLGATSGAASAAALVGSIPLRALLLVSASLAAIAILALPSGPSAPLAPRATTHSERRERLASDPFVRCLALLLGASSAAFVMLDFTFKWTVTRALDAGQVASFIARFYALLSGASLIAQLVASRAVVERLGVSSAIVVPPLAILFISALAFVSGGAMSAVIVLKAVDATLRYSLHRMTTELAYLPLPAAIRARAKPLLDGALVRVVQALAGSVLLAVGARGHFSPRGLVASTIVVVAPWGLGAWAMRRAYVEVLRRTIKSDALTPSISPDPFDLETAEALIDHLSNDDPLTVLGALNALARRDRMRLVPALILLHEDEAVVSRALAMFAASDRTDWIERARKLLRCSREVVRMAAARALAARGHLAVKDLEGDTSSRVQGYAALYVALDRGEDLAHEPELAALLASSKGARIGVLSAIADAPRAARLAGLLEAIASDRCAHASEVAVLARAAGVQRASALIPTLIAHVTLRESRSAVRAALTSFGDVALDALAAALAEPSSARALRVHLPDTVRRFGDARAAALLLDVLENDRDGLVRYKALRALGRLVAERGMALDRVRVERLAFRNLVEHFRLLGLRAHLDPHPFHMPARAVGSDPTERLLVGMLNDKLRQSLERVFRLLKIAHTYENVHGVHDAITSNDKHARANALELLDTLLSKRDQANLRRLLRIAVEEHSAAEAVARARAFIHQTPPGTRDEALDRLAHSEDATLAALAQLHVAAASGRASRVILASRERAGIELAMPVARHV